MWGGFRLKAGRRGAKRDTLVLARVACLLTTREVLGGEFVLVVAEEHEEVDKGEEDDEELDEDNCGPGLWQVIGHFGGSRSAMNASRPI